HREYLFQSMLDLWIGLGQSASYSTVDETHRIGPLLRFFRACVGPLLEDLSDEAIVYAIRRRLQGVLAPKKIIPKHPFYISTAPRFTAPYQIQQGAETCRASRRRCASSATAFRCRCRRPHSRSRLSASRTASVRLSITSSRVSGSARTR